MVYFNIVHEFTRKFFMPDLEKCKRVHIADHELVVICQHYTARNQLACWMTVLRLKLANGQSSLDAISTNSPQQAEYNGCLQWLQSAMKTVSMLQGLTVQYSYSV